VLKLAASKEEVKQAQLTVAKVEDKAVIVVVNGWRMRVYFDESLGEKAAEKFAKGQLITVEYVGELEDVHKLKFLPLKNVK
jgi:hypothetical protein